MKRFSLPAALVLVSCLAVACVAASPTFVTTDPAPADGSTGSTGSTGPTVPPPVQPAAPVQVDACDPTTGSTGGDESTG